MVKPYINNLSRFLLCDKIIDFKDDSIKNVSDELYANSKGELDYIKNAYEFVRDKISHSADINHDILTCSASSVLNAKHGICFAKSHLLVALLRAKNIPSGFCYQKLILDDELYPILIYHGLVGLYIKEYNKWIRLDARGNKEGVNAEFSIDEEKLAFPIRSEFGEEDGFVVYPNPDEKIIQKFKNYKTRTELWNDLPTELAYLDK